MADQTRIDEQALADARAVLERIQRDIDAAAAARAAYREGRTPTVAPDEPGLALEDGEAVVAVRQAARLDRRVRDGHGDTTAGRLYLTTRRLVLRPGGATAGELTVPLADILELDVLGERLLLTLAGGDGLSLDVTEPRTLRVHIAATRAAHR